MKNQGIRLSIILLIQFLVCNPSFALTGEDAISEYIMRGTREVREDEVISSIRSEANLIRQGRYAMALHCAVIENDIEIARELIEAGISTRTFNVHGRTALHLAVMADKKNFIEFLIGHGIDYFQLTQDGHNIYELSANEELKVWLSEKIAKIRALKYFNGNLSDITQKQSLADILIYREEE